MLLPKDPGQSGTAIPASSLVTKPPMPINISVAQKAVRVIDSTPRRPVEVPAAAVAAPQAESPMQTSTKPLAISTSEKAELSSGKSQDPTTNRSTTPVIAPERSAALQR